VSVSVLMASIGVLLLGNTPSAAAENTAGLSLAAGMSWVGDCQTGVVETVGCDVRAFSFPDATPLESFQTPGTLWSSDRFVGCWAGLQFTVEEGQAYASAAQDIPLVDDQTTPPRDETPTGAKVPEPATMVLLGMGVITMSRVARAKQQPRKQSRQVPRLVSAYQP
jgi:hypothetical protein